MAKDTKEEILRALAEMSKMIMTRFDRVHSQFNNLLRHFDYLEKNLILQDHARRIETLERKVGLT